MSASDLRRVRRTRAGFALNDRFHHTVYGPDQPAPQYHHHHHHRREWTVHLNCAHAHTCTHGGDIRGHVTPRSANRSSDCEVEANRAETGTVREWEDEWEQQH